MASATTLKILALDPATKCGWAHSNGQSGVWDLSVRADESNGMRLIRLKSMLNQALDKHGIDLVVFEASRNLKYGKAVKVAMQLQGVIELWCSECGIEYCGYSPTEIKKHATGKGNSDKDAMIEAAQKKWGENIIDHNQADALWLLDKAVQTYGN